MSVRNTQMKTKDKNLERHCTPLKPITNTAWVRARLCKLQKKGALDSQPQVIKFTSCLPMVGGSLRVLRLPPSLKLVAIIWLKYC
jgi:hypothetical protein